jgi:hypothetical protein
MYGSLFNGLKGLLLCRDEEKLRCIGYRAGRKQFKMCWHTKKKILMVQWFTRLEDDDGKFVCSQD